VSEKPQAGHSGVQQAAEAVIRDALTREPDLPDDLEARWIPLSEGTRCSVDAVSADLGVLVEISAQTGRPKPAQTKKIAADALKLITLREKYPQARLMIAFCDDEAAQHYRHGGWLAFALENHKIEVRVVDIPDALRVRLREAKARQNMASAPRYDADAAADGLGAAEPDLPSGGIET
jgi:hypothetical protein